jgi:hypothetical protein
MPGSIGAALPLKLSDDLTLSVGAGVIRLSPTQGLEFSEELARKSFRRMLEETARDFEREHQ